MMQRRLKRRRILPNREHVLPNRRSGLRHLVPGGVTADKIISHGRFA
jgi:hypothetical protein